MPRLNIGRMPRMDEDIDRRCPAYDAVMLPRMLPSGDLYDDCPNCRMPVV